MASSGLGVLHEELGCGDAIKLWTWIVGTCIAFSYVVSLYIHPFGKKFFAFPTGERNDPAEIQSRFHRVLYASIFSLILSTTFQFFRAFSSGSTPDLSNIVAMMGFRLTGLGTAAIIPVLLTLLLFSGPLLGDYLMGRFRGYNRAFVSLLYHNRHFRRRILRDSLYSLIWWRAYVVAPLSEEFVYRACLVPVVISCYGQTAAILMSPLSFGVAHLHHIFDRIRLGTSVMEAVTTTLFQIFYTCLFGAYSTYLFVRTEHFIAPVLVHALCNSLGVPDVAALKSERKGVIIAAYFLGLFSWMLLLDPVTTPSLYGNLEGSQVSLVKC
jgi:prenyl protein peptidase